MMRKKPYTEMGISRVPCLRCGKPSSQQWQICSLNNLYAGICTECDIVLNRLVLNFMGVDDVDSIINDYKQKISKQQICDKKGNAQWNKRWN